MSILLLATVRTILELVSMIPSAVTLLNVMMIVSIMLGYTKFISVSTKRDFFK